jgi:hypothetical protein
MKSKQEKKKIETTRKLIPEALERRKKTRRQRRNLADQTVNLGTSISSLVIRKESNKL